MSIIAVFQKARRAIRRDIEEVQVGPRLLTDIVSTMEQNGRELEERIAFDKDTIVTLEARVAALECQKRSKASDIERAGRIVSKINDFVA